MQTLNNVFKNITAHSVVVVLLRKKKKKTDIKDVLRKAKEVINSL